MNALDIQKLRDLPIEGVAERLRLHVSRHKCLCPFHADTNPSLTFNARKNTYRCYVCGASGNSIELVMHHLRLSFADACRWLAKSSNVIVEEHQAPTKPREADRPFKAAHYARFFEHPLLDEAAKRFLFAQRRLSPLVVERCRLNAWRSKDGIHWLQIPYFDVNGRLIGIQSRNLDYRKPSAEEREEDLPPRFRFPRGSQCNIYNLPMVNHLVTADNLFIAEGSSDCWALLSAGQKAIAIPSATLLRPADMELLRKVVAEKQVRLHMYPDRDAPGERLFLQLKGMFPTIAHHDLPPDCKDYSDYYLSKLIHHG